MEETNNELREDLVANISELFLKYGLRSTSMDDIANHLKISKKTLYQHFSNKEDVVEQVMLHRRRKRDKETNSDEIRKKNPVQVLSSVKSFMASDIHNKYPSNFYDLRKYYPSVFQKLRAEDESFSKRFLETLIEQGIEQGYFRKEIDTDIQVYLFSKQLRFLQEPDNLTDYTYPLQKIVSTIIDNFLLAIATKKGLETFEEMQRRPESQNYNEK